ncbi:lactonase family protein [Stackebrandtia soli]|uniref:lactonase family protein n=1 Tax=Stackebrandtia soli TaxID=1892856 RepID=UPI0039E9C283
MRLIMGSHHAVGIVNPHGGEFDSRLELINPSYVVPSPDGIFLYVVSENLTEPGSVHCLRREGERLVPHGPARPSGGEQPCHASIHPSGKYLLVANYGSGTVAALPIEADGVLGEPASIVAHEGSGPDKPRQNGPHAHQIITDPSGQWVLACDLGTDEVFVYRLEEATGRLAEHSAAHFVPGQGVRHIAFAPDGERAYVVAELSSEVIVCDWDATDGRLTPINSISTVSMDGDRVTDNYPGAVVVSRDGSRVYVTNRGHDSIAVIDGELFELIGTRPCEGEWPRDARISPDGGTLYVANENSGAVVPFDITERVPVPIDGAVIDFPGVTSVWPL